MSERRWSTICAVVERPDHHCGDDLVIVCFSTLIPKANYWLCDNIHSRLVKCETIEKKIKAVDELHIDNVLFTPSGKHAVCVKGLR